ncbi:hypothetical protein FHY52_28140 [Nocardia nova]|uniref:PspA-associated protein PspAA n=1 Tax=Nocardia nova TaxID=37330 RepID=UPI0025AF394A|nr:hypothetical protein [Nocardia nova]MDN2500527.1 hypothetical protein [Nocardia nova]
MIVRILGEGQYTLDDARLSDLNELDDELLQAADAADDTGFSLVLGRMLATVRDLATPVADDALVASDLVLPSADMPLAEVHAMLRDDGLIPG